MLDRASDSASAVFALGKGARTGEINVGGHVAGRDVVITTIPAQAAEAQDMSQALDLLNQIESQIASLAEAPAGLRDDAQDEVRKAVQAGSQGDTPRLVEKLRTAQGYLERIGQSLPAAFALSQSLATLALRVSGQG
jgi:hypothetical protein